MHLARLETNSPFTIVTGNQSSAALSSSVPEDSNAFMYKFGALLSYLNMSVAY